METQINAKIALQAKETATLIRKLAVEFNMNTTGIAYEHNFDNKINESFLTEEKDQSKVNAVFVISTLFYNILSVADIVEAIGVVLEEISNNTEAFSLLSDAANFETEALKATEDLNEALKRVPFDGNYVDTLQDRIRVLEESAREALERLIDFGVEAKARSCEPKAKDQDIQEEGEESELAFAAQISAGARECVIEESRG
jgi:hypothetical protein